jgi:hypothetical protein
MYSFRPEKIAIEEFKIYPIKNPYLAIRARALFRLLLNSKFFHSLFVTSIFGRIHGALNVDKNN